MEDLYFGFDISPDRFFERASHELGVDTMSGYVSSYIEVFSTYDDCQIEPANFRLD